MSAKHYFTFTDRNTGKKVQEDAQYGKEHAMALALSQLGIDITENRLYGVSYGNGNDGVSQLFPNFYVWTDDPYNVARLAMIGQFGAKEDMEYAAEAVDVDGEAGCTVSATILDPPDDEPEGRGYYRCDNCANHWKEEAKEDESKECPKCGSTVEQSDLDITSSWSDNNGAWKIVEVFGVEEDDIRKGVSVYDSLEDAFNEELRKYMED